VKIGNVDTKFMLALREKRSEANTRAGEPVKPATLKKDIDFVRLTLRYAKQIEKCLDELPEFPSFRGEAWEVVPNPRPFLDHDQWVTSAFTCANRPVAPLAQLEFRAESRKSADF
jgi:hypothetical protein